MKKVATVLSFVFVACVVASDARLKKNITALSVQDVL